MGAGTEARDVEDGRRRGGGTASVDGGRDVVDTRDDCIGSGGFRHGEPAP